MSILYKGLSKDASYQILIHLVKRLQRRFFRNQPIRNKNCLWRPDWLISKKLSPLKPLGKMNQNLVGSILGKSFIKNANLVPIR
jgi:hypothetical protein